MPSTYVLARDHLQRAAVILSGEDRQSRQLCAIIERTICLLEDMNRDAVPAPRSAGNVVDMAWFRLQQGLD